MWKTRGKCVRACECEHVCEYACMCVGMHVYICVHVCVFACLRVFPPCWSGLALAASPGTSLVLSHRGERGSWPRAWLCVLPARALPTPVCSPSRSSPGQGENQVLLSSSVSPGVCWCRLDTGAASALVLFSLVTWLPPACLKREHESVPRVEAGG